MGLVFIPLDSAKLASWATTNILLGPVRGVAVTQGLNEAFEPVDSEEAERTALLVASLSSLLATWRRLVAVAEGEFRLDPDADPDFGGVVSADLPYSSVQSLFVDASEVEVLDEAAAAVAGLTITQAWDVPEARRLLEQPLLWHGAGEWHLLLPG